MKSVFYFLPFLLLIACGTTAHKNAEKGMPSEPGKCFAKCLIPDKSEEKLVGEFLVFTGENTNTEGVVYREIITREASTKWEKKKADRNCRSSNPEDCMVWCLVEVPEQSVIFYEVTDTTLVKDYSLEEVYASLINEEEDLIKWKETICDNDITPALYSSIQQSLIDQGYDIGKDEVGDMGPASKSAFIQFQKDYNLPIGGLNIESLDALGVEY